MMEFPGLESEAITAQAEEAGVAIAGGLDASEELMRRVVTAVMMAISVVLMLRHWQRHSGAGGFANIQWCAVATEDFHR